MHRKGLIKSFSKMLISYLWMAKIVILPVTLLYPFFKASCLKNSTTPLRCSLNETSSQQEVIFLPYELLKNFAFPSFLFTLMFYLIFTVFFTSIYYMHYKHHLTQPITPTFLDHFLHQAYPKSTLSCFSLSLNGKSSVSLTSSQLLQL